MTVDEYYTAIKNLGLKPSSVPTVYLDSDGMTCSVPSPHGKTSEQVEEILGKIKERLGVSQRGA